MWSVPAGNYDRVGEVARRDCQNATIAKISEIENLYLTADEH